VHSAGKGNQWFIGMRCSTGVNATSDLVHSVINTAANVHELNITAYQLQGEERVVYEDSGHLGIENHEEKEDSPCNNNIIMRPSQRHALPYTPEGCLEHLFETANTRLRAKLNHPFLVIERQLGFQKTCHQVI